MGLSLFVVTSFKITVLYSASESDCYLSLNTSDSQSACTVLKGKVGLASGTVSVEAETRWLPRPGSFSTWKTLIMFSGASRVVAAGRMPGIPISSGKLPLLRRSWFPVQSGAVPYCRVQEAPQGLCNMQVRSARELQCKVSFPLNFLLSRTGLLMAFSGRPNSLPT